MRNQYMEEIYANLTINLSHLASTLIMYYLENEQQQVSKCLFYRTLYLAIKELQNNKGINLHRSLLNPDEYYQLLDGKSKRFEHFIDVAELSELISSSKDYYIFSPKLREECDFDTIRMENLIAVYNNEAEPISAVRNALINAIDKGSEVTKIQLAELAFNDELVSFAWDKKRYSRPQYNDINERETVEENPEPFLLIPKNSNGIGVLLIHGLLASPAEVRGYAEELYKLGYTVFGVRLKGHGTSPYELREQSFEDWYQSAQRGMGIIKVYCDSIVLIGFSTGGGLALKLAAEVKDKINAVIAVAVPVKFVDKSFLFLPLLHGTNRLVRWVSSVEGVKPFIENKPEHEKVNYRNVPVKSLYELNRLIDNIKQLLSKIEIPVLIIHADEDPVVHKDSGNIIMNRLGSVNKKLITIHSNRHGILMDNIGGTWESINRFLEENVLSVEIKKGSGLDGQDNSSRADFSPL